MATANKVDQLVVDIHAKMEKLEQYLTPPGRAASHEVYLVLRVDGINAFEVAVEHVDYAYDGAAIRTYAVGRGMTVHAALIVLVPELDREVATAQTFYREARKG